MWAAVHLYKYCLNYALKKKNLISEISIPINKSFIFCSVLDVTLVHEYTNGMYRHMTTNYDEYIFLQTRQHNFWTNCNATMFLLL